MEQDKERMVACSICGEDTFETECDCDDHMNYCLGCEIILPMLDFHANCLTAKSIQFWTGLANYCFKQRDIEMQIRNQHHDK